MFIAIPVLVLIVAGFLPRRLLGRASLVVGAVTMLATFGISLAIILGPNSDTSVHLSNWQTHQTHGFFVGVLVAELAVAGVFALLASRPPNAAAARGLFLASGLGTLVVTYMLLIAMSN